MQALEKALITNIDSRVENELGGESVGDINKLCEAIIVHSHESKIETHLLLVGGNVRPEKQGLTHKDVDLKLYSPDLASEIFMGGDCPKFDKFAAFVSDVGKSLGWGVEIEKPWFNDYEYCGDGKVTLYPSGKPIEVLPVRVDGIYSSFEEFLLKDTDPHLALF
ncbi:MAG: hypothetical protein WC503_05185 [Candidatus Shapirobacteria bacterium]